MAPDSGGEEVERPSQSCQADRGARDEGGGGYRQRRPILKRVADANGVGTASSRELTPGNNARRNGTGCSPGTSAFFRRAGTGAGELQVTDATC